MPMDDDALSRLRSGLFWGFLAAAVAVILPTPGMSASYVWQLPVRFVAAGLLAGVGFACRKLIKTSTERQVERIWAEAAEKMEEWDRKRQEAAEAAAAYERELADARGEAERYYAENASLLADTFPPALFRSVMKSAIPDNCELQKAWVASRDIINRLRPLVAEAREQRRAEEERQRKAEQAKSQEKSAADKEIALLRARLDALAGRTDDDALDEIVALNRKIAQLQGRKERQTITPDDL